MRRSIPPASGKTIHAPSQWSDANRDRIRVSTFNILRGRDSEDKTRLDLVSETLGNDDISGLQEVLGPPWFSDINQAQEIAKSADMGWLFAPVQTQYYRVYLGNALLSRIPVQHWMYQPLVYSEHSRKHRNYISASIRINSVPVTLIVTHLDKGKIRTSQLEQILAEFDNSEHGILMGDLNTFENDPVLANWLEKNPGSDALQLALDEKDPKERIDWILVRGFNVIKGGMQHHAVSDHPYYWAELELIE